MKKLLFVIVFLVAGGVVASSVLSRKAPGWLRTTLEESLGKDVRIGDILYHFPSSFEVRDFKILERAPFPREIAFAVGSMHMSVSLPALARRELRVRKIEVENPEIVVRKKDNRVHHALSGVAAKTSEPSSSKTEPAPGKDSKGSGTQLAIEDFEVKGGVFRFIDYDVEATGFVVALDRIDARIRDLELPFSDATTRYEVSARLAQGRDREGAPFQLEGWTRFRGIDTDSRVELKGVSLPYFRPYYAQVTPATINEGTLDARLSAKAVKNELTLNADLEIAGLLFGGYESGEELFGLKAEEILPALKSPTGRLQIPFTVSWNLADPNVRPGDVIRKGITQSLQRVAFANVGNILAGAIKKYADPEKTPGTPTDNTAENIEAVADKLKELFD